MQSLPQIKLTAVKINEVWCKKCGICTAFCSRGVLVQTPDKKILAEKIENCIGCGICVNLCPDYALSLEMVE